MKKVERVVVGSGITKHVEERVTLESDADFQSFIANAKRQFDWDSYTSRDIAALKAALAQAEGGERRNWKPREDREWFWEMMLMHHEIASTHMAKGNISAAMCAAARYGSYRALHDIKFAHETAALYGYARIADSQNAGAATRKQSADARISRVQELQPTMGLVAAFSKVGEELGVSPSTIKADWYKRKKCSNPVD